MRACVSMPSCGVCRGCRPRAGRPPTACATISAARWNRSWISSNAACGWSATRRACPGRHCAARPCASTTSCGARRGFWRSPAASVPTATSTRPAAAGSTIRRRSAKRESPSRSCRRSTAPPIACCRHWPRDRSMRSATKCDAAARCWPAASVGGQVQRRGACRANHSVADTTVPSRRRAASVRSSNTCRSNSRRTLSSSRQASSRRQCQAMSAPQ